MLKIITCDFSDQLQCEALVMLMNEYITGDMGGNLPALTPEKEVLLLEGLEKHPSKLVLLAKEGESYVGLVNCFINFGTFACKPFINIHDIVVLKSHRGRGVGKALLLAVDKHARLLDCGKTTLEVRSDNVVAQKLYKKLHFNECNPVMHFWAKNY